MNVQHAASVGKQAAVSESKRDARRPRPARPHEGRSRRAPSNQALQRLLRSGAVQTKLRVSRPSDPLEREADRVADQVMRMADADVSVTPAPELVQRSCCSSCAGGGSCEDEKLLRQASQSYAGIEVDRSIITAGLGAGRPLPASERAFFEPRFGMDLGHVRVHDGSAAAKAAASIYANAFTLGQDIVFGAGQYSPGTTAGRWVIAHELSHAVQQGAFGLQRQEIGETEEPEEEIPGSSGETVLSTGTVPIQFLAPAPDIPQELIDSLPEGESIEVTVVEGDASSGEAGAFGGVSGVPGWMPFTVGGAAISAVDQTLMTKGFAAAGVDAVGLVGFPQSRAVRTLMGGSPLTPGPLFPGSRVLLGHSALYVRQGGQIITIRSFGPASQPQALLNLLELGKGTKGVPGKILDHTSLLPPPGGRMFNVSGAWSVEFPVNSSSAQQLLQVVDESTPGLYTARPEVAGKLGMAPRCYGQNCVMWAVETIEEATGGSVGPAGGPHLTAGDAARQGHVMKFMKGVHEGTTVPSTLPGQTGPAVTGTISTKMRVIKIGGNVFRVLGAGVTVYRVVEAETPQQRKEVIAEEAGGWAGGALGSLACVALGLTGWGLFGCALIIGGGLGYAGSAAGKGLVSGGSGPIPEGRCQPRNLGFGEYLQSDCTIKIYKAMP